MPSLPDEVDLHRRAVVHRLDLGQHARLREVDVADGRSGDMTRLWSLSSTVSRPARSCVSAPGSVARSEARRRFRAGATSGVTKRPPPGPIRDDGSRGAAGAPRNGRPNWPELPPSRRTTHTDTVTLRSILWIKDSRWRRWRNGDRSTNRCYPRARRSSGAPPAEWTLAISLDPVGGARGQSTPTLPSHTGCPSSALRAAGNPSEAQMAPSLGAYGDDDMAVAQEPDARARPGTAGRGARAIGPRDA